MAVYFLGIKYGHDAGATLVKDGKVIRAAHEERFSRIKHDDNFPEKSIRWILKDAKISISDIEKVGISSSPYIPKEEKRKILMGGLKRLVSNPLLHQKWIWVLFKNKKVIEIFRKKCLDLGFNLDQIEFVNHHITHLASSYYSTDKQSGCLISLDGMGEYRTGVIAKGVGNKIIEKKEFLVPDSIGFFYSAATQFIGFEPMDGEYKVMGLAPYGKADPCYKQADKLIRFDTEKCELKMNYPYFENTNFPDILKFLYKPKERKFFFYSPKFVRLFRGYKKEDIAAAFQKKLEVEGVKIAKKAIGMTGENDLFLSGGIFLNVKLNKKLLELNEVRNVYPHPAAGDSGCATGAALYLYYKYYPNAKRYNLNHCYLGAKYNSLEYLESSKYDYKKVSPKKIAALIADGEIVGFYNGRAEYGPRALGHRTILADPRRANMKDKINAAVKFREPFRPFCPSMLKEKVDDYLRNPKDFPIDSPFMNMSYDVISKEIPAVTHVDNTARPQTVEKSISPYYYKVIKEFERITGIAGVLNTSFNVKGEPIVDSPKDAHNCFMNSGINHLVIEKYIISK